MGARRGESRVVVRRGKQFTKMAVDTPRKGDFQRDPSMAGAWRQRALVGVPRGALRRAAVQPDGGAPEAPHPRPVGQGAGPRQRRQWCVTRIRSEGEWGGGVELQMRRRAPRGTSGDEGPAGSHFLIPDPPSSSAPFFPHPAGALECDPYHPSSERFFLSLLGLGAVCGSTKWEVLR